MKVRTATILFSGFSILSYKSTEKIIKLFFSETVLIITVRAIRDIDKRADYQLAFKRTI